MARQSPRFKQQPRYLVICEDSKSSRIYLDEAFYHHRVSNYIYTQHIGSTDPLNIVRKAIKACSTHDQVFCVVDRDNHQNFDQAMHEAAQHLRVRMIVSYPCYEFWFCLHLSYSRKSYSHVGSKSAANRLIADLCKSHELFADYSKGKIHGLYSKIITQHEQMLKNAFRHSLRILEEVAKDGQLNPSTQIHQLLSVIPSLEHPQPLDQL